MLKSYMKLIRILSSSRSVCRYSRASTMTTLKRARRVSSRTTLVPQRPDQDSKAAGQDRQPTSGGSDNEESDGASRPKKRKRTVASFELPNIHNDKTIRHASLFSTGTPLHSPTDAIALDSRSHSILYHRPLLLHEPSGKKGRQALLAWFDSVSHTRKMPWRKNWTHPQKYASKPAASRKLLEKRAYEVWISEIMLQQTRVATVIDYWNGWMGRWPTIQDLAMAGDEEVRKEWQGLGYYSRATRILEASKFVTAHPDLQGLLPDEVESLVKQIPGVGRYTAGAICAIVFGKAVPMVDGNVLRVLSRQLGIYADVQRDKDVVDAMWAAAEALVVAATNDATVTPSSDSKEPAPSDVPGRWGQALMELGSTICTPIPNCAECPISDTCRVYSEAKASLKKSKSETEVKTAQNKAKAKAQTTTDIEDFCTLCQPFGESAPEEADEAKDAKLVESKQRKTSKQMTLTAFAFTGRKAPESSKLAARDDAKKIATYAKRFPVKTATRVRFEETLVCAIRRPDNRYLITKRPEKGLLAGLWEFPSYMLENPATPSVKPTGKSRDENKQLAKDFVGKLVKQSITVGERTPVPGKRSGATVDFIDDVESIPWVFSHIKLTMHVLLFEVYDEGVADVMGKEEGMVWTNDGAERPMGTGMRKCWDFVQGVRRTELVIDEVVAMYGGTTSL